MTTMTIEKPKKASTRKPSPGSRSDLLRYVGDLERLSAAMLALGEQAPERMTVSQLIFFVSAAASDLQGGMPTYTDIKQEVGPTLNKSLHTTYKLFLEPNKQFPGGLGWLAAEVDPRDNRQRILRLTAKGREAVMAAGLELKGE